MKLTTNKILSVICGVTMSALAGCSNADKSDAIQFFRAEEGISRLNDIAAAQAAAGAASDATLQSFHFTGANLNSLGEEKLDLMLPDDEEADVVVYVNLPETAPTTAERKDAVVAFLTDCGIDESHMKIELGRNPSTATPAGIGMARMPKTESGGVEITSAPVGAAK